MDNVTNMLKCLEPTKSRQIHQHFEMGRRFENRLLFRFKNWLQTTFRLCVFINFLARLMKMRSPNMHGFKYVRSWFSARTAKRDRKRHVFKSCFTMLQRIKKKQPYKLFSFGFERICVHVCIIFQHIANLIFTIHTTDRCEKSLRKFFIRLCAIAAQRFMLPSSQRVQ